MKKHTKKILGLFGLAGVVAMTFCAALMPVSDTRAEDKDSATDTIEIRVVGNTPSIEVSKVDPGDVVLSQYQTIVASYANIDTMSAGVSYVDVNDNPHYFNIFNDAKIDYAPGEVKIIIDLITGEYTYTYQYYDEETETVKTFDGNGVLDDYGYGDYRFEFSGVGFSGEPVYGGLSFGYQPVRTDISSDSETGNIKIDVDYDDKAEGDQKVGKVEIVIRDEAGNVVGPSPIILEAPSKSFTFNPGDYGMGPGNYYFEVTAYNTKGTKLGKTYIIKFEYAGKKVRQVPDTGGLSGELNISQTDFMVTGLIVFGVVGIGGMLFIAKRDKKTRRRK